jgi:subtilisin family serine protease
LKNMFPPKPPRRSRLFPDLHKSRAVFEPGIIEIKLKENVRPQVLQHGGKTPPRLVSLANVNLDDLHRTLDRVRARKIEQAIPISHERADELVADAAKRGAKSEHLAHFFRVHLPLNAPVEKIAEEFAKLPNVERARPLPQRTICANPNDPLLGVDDDVKTDSSGMEDQWYIFRCNANQAWDKSISGKTAAVAVIDQGFLGTHEDLQPHVKQTFNAMATPASGAPPAPLDGNNLVDLHHGTGTAGLAGAVGNNGLGISGFAYDADLWLIQVSRKGAAGQKDRWNTTSGIGWVTAQASPGVRRVVSISIGNGVEGAADLTMDTNSADAGIINTAIDAEIPVCLAAANDDAWHGRDVSTDANNNPAPATSRAIIVGATQYDDSKNVRAGFSNWGPRVTVCAPGDINHDLTCAPNAAASGAKYVNGFGGTSGATPKVAGTVALMLQANPNLTPDQIKAILNGSGRDRTTGDEDFAKPVGPLLDALSAVIHAQTTPGARLAANRFLNFGSLGKGDTGKLTVSLFNIGQTVLNVQAPNQTSGSTDFTVSQAPNFPLQINAGDPNTQTIEISFTPSTRGDQTAQFEIKSDDPDTPLTVVCTGTTPSLLWLWILLGILIAGAAAGGVYALLKATKVV